MAGFTDLDWTRFDVCAIVAHRGLVVVEPERTADAAAWLAQSGYSVVVWDCGQGVRAAVTQLSDLLHWPAQFGYSLDAEIRGLDAIRDGFQSDEWPSGAVAFEVLSPEVVWQEDSRWLLGILSIASEQSLQWLALGRRFLTMIVTHKRSPVVGQLVDSIVVPAAYVDRFSSR